MDLIDREKIGLTDLEILLCDGDYKAALEMLTNKIDDAPRIDAEPVIRCKDCKYYEVDAWYICELLDHHFKGDDYCSKGKRKEEQ